MFNWLRGSQVKARMLLKRNCYPYRWEVDVGHERKIKGLAALAACA